MVIGKDSSMGVLYKFKADCMSPSSGSIMQESLATLDTLLLSNFTLTRFNISR